AVALEQEVVARRARDAHPRRLVGALDRLALGVRSAYAGPLDFDVVVAGGVDFERRILAARDHQVLAARALDDAVVDGHGAAALFPIGVEQGYARRQPRAARILLIRVRYGSAARCEHCESGHIEPTLRSCLHVLSP